VTLEPAAWNGGNGMAERNVGLFVDTENLFGGYGSAYRPVDIRATVAAVKSVLADSALNGAAVVGRAYANWAYGRLMGLRRDIQALGLELVHVEGSSAPLRQGPQATPAPDTKDKNAADIHLAVDALAMAYERPGMEVFVIVSGDGGLTPLVHHLHRLGRTVVGASHEGKHSAALVGACDHFLFLSPAGERAPRLTAAPPERSSQPASRLAVTFDTFDDAVTAAVGDALEAAQFVSLGWLQNDVKTRMTGDAFGKIAGTGWQPRLVERLQTLNYAVVTLPEATVKVVMRVSDVPEGARHYSEPPREEGSREIVTPKFRSVGDEVAATGDEDVSRHASEADAESTWWRSSAVSRIVVASHSLD